MAYGGFETQATPERRGVYADLADNTEAVRLVANGVLANTFQLSERGNPSDASRIKGEIADRVVEAKNSHYLNLPRTPQRTDENTRYLTDYLLGMAAKRSTEDPNKIAAIEARMEAGALKSYGKTVGVPFMQALEIMELVVDRMAPAAQPTLSPQARR